MDEVQRGAVVFALGVTSLIAFALIALGMLLTPGRTWSILFRVRSAKAAGQR